MTDTQTNITDAKLAEVVEKKRQKSARYNQSEKGLARARRYSSSDKGRDRDRRTVTKHRERRRARDAVHHQVRIGSLPPPTDCPCARCGNPSHGYHHHKGYLPPHVLDVVPMCTPCHKKEDELVRGGGIGNE